MQKLKPERNVSLRKRMRRTRNQKRNYFLPDIKASSRDWQLPTELTEFFVERCQRYMTDKELEGFREVPAPNTINEVIPLSEGSLREKGP